MVERIRDFAQCTALRDDILPQEYTLAGAVCSLGRAVECDIVVPHNIVSRLHARIERDGPRYLLLDLESANGTFVNDRRISRPHRLKHFDKIGLGVSTAVLRFIDPDPTFEPVDQLRYDPRSLQFFVGSSPVDLTPTQVRLLAYLYHNTGTVCTRESCMEAVWGPNYNRDRDDQALDGVIAVLRRKLREVAPDTDLIKTRRGLGYVLNV